SSRTWVCFYFFTALRLTFSKPLGWLHHSSPQRLGHHASFPALVFLSHYIIWVGKKVCWVSLAPLPKMSLFNAYMASYKGFKSQFVKVKAVGRTRFCADSRPLPLYWRLPLKSQGFLKSQHSLEGKVDLQLLEELPRGMNCKELVALALESKPLYYLESFDMEGLIRKAKQVSQARGTSIAPKEAVCAGTALSGK
ncbi:hypothetical protein CR513_39073, partial [Mucuna pruriens]